MAPYLANSLAQVAQVLCCFIVQKHAKIWYETVWQGMEFNIFQFLLAARAEVKLFIMDKILFLDRDGVINKKAPPHQHIVTLDEFIILPRVKEALSLAKNKGYKIIIITN